MTDNPLQELEGFLHFLYENETGLVYTPIKDPVSGKWEKVFFNWPDQLTEIITHVVSNSPSREVYIGPALYNFTEPTKTNIKGSHVVWTEYDGNSPVQQNGSNIPPPSYRIQSSILGHEHFYWKLDRFETDISRVESINRAITYTTSADASAWDITQILRPPATINHKHEKPVLSILRSETAYNIELFNQLPIPALVTNYVDETKLPEVMGLIAKYNWGIENYEFFCSNSILLGLRSSSLMRLGYICAELRMRDDECFAILADADARWGKFVGRSDRHQRILDIINKARLKYPLVSILNDKIEVMSFEELLSSNIQLEWLVEGLVQKGGHMLVSGPPSVGKTQLSLRCAMCMAVGKPFLKWDIPNPMKIIFVSMEMGPGDLKHFLSQMAVTLDDTERKLLAENFFIAPLGYGIPVDSEAGQEQLNNLIKEHRPNGIFLDSLGVSTEGDLGEATAKKLAIYTARIRSEYDLFIWFIHHNRKAQVSNKKPNRLSDIYGSIFITAAATTVIGLWPDDGGIEVTGLKTRLSEGFSPFIVSRNDDLDFSIVHKIALEKEARSVPRANAPKQRDADDGGFANSSFV